MRPRNAVIFSSLLLLLISGCSPFKPVQRNASPDRMPTSFSLYSEEAPPPSRWWESFGSEELNSLVAASLAGDFDVRTAWAKLKQAEAAAEAAGADLYPGVTGEGSVSHQRSETSAGAVQTTENHALGLAASYEVDLWGGLNSSVEAERLTARASREDLNTAAMTVAGQVTENWIDIISAREQLRLLGEQLKTNEDYLDLLETRFKNSQATSLDVLQQRETVAQVRAQFPALEAQEKVLEHELALLLGRAPQDGPAITTGTLPELSPLPAIGLPADLLAARPDVRAAGLRLRSADWSVAAARADRLPSLSLTGSLQYSGAGLSQIFDNWLFKLIGSLTGPVFDGGRRAALVEKARAAAEERLSVYEKTVLTAVKEVENALVREKKQAETVAAQERQLAAARQAFEEARRRYIKGVDNYSRPLSELVSVQSLERQLVQSRAGLLQYRVALFRALGGNWTDNLSPDGLKTGEAVANTSEKQEKR